MCTALKSLRVGTLNFEWASSAERLRQSREAVSRSDCGLFVATEMDGNVFSGGFVVDAGPDWGYRNPRTHRRKVAMWSAQPWANWQPWARGATLGRIVVAETATPIGPITCVGVCIPWKDAHVRTGRSDSKPWSQHLEFLEILHEYLGGIDGPVVLSGDFNQRIPRRRQPQRVFDSLSDGLEGYEVVTAGDPDRIDHIALSPHLRSVAEQSIEGRSAVPAFSDHDGVINEVQSV